ncbi:MAG: ATP-dependent zinc metalloprotease FtsH [Clostridiales bacterium]|nr:ATP-dependent zinc metalloprotease FtsH [Candidatus Apopatousia equi]
MTKNKKNRGILIALLAIVLAFVLFYVLTSINNVEQINITKFEELVRTEKITDVYGVGSTFRIRTVDSKYSREDFEKGKGEDYIFVVTSITKDNMVDAIKKYNETHTDPDSKIILTSNPEPKDWLSTLIPILSFVLIAVFAFMIIKSISGAGNKGMGFGKTKARNTQISKVKFSDVAGAKEEKYELKEVVDFLSNSKKFIDLGARIPKGVLLVGPPGTGKTMLAKAVAGESHVPFFQISGSDFVEMFVGVGASRVRDLFEQAKRSAPAIVFIDEIDAVGRQRGAGLGGGNDEREQTLNQLLVEMDGFESTTGIIVMAATNRPDVLDPALLRPGRFDRQIYVNMPDVGEREEILKVHAKNKSFTDDVNFKNLARITSGFSGADLENLLNEAAILAGRDNRLRITMKDLNEASTKVMMGPQKRSKTVTERDKKITAYHESGHAILHKLLPYCDEVQEVSIIPRGMAGGYTMSRPENDDNYATVNKLNNMIASYMGGRIAEELIFNDISTGASNDIEQATKLARKMVTQFGMSEKLGFINLGSTSEVFIGRDYQTQNVYSESTAKIIDDEVEKILKKNYQEAKQILTDNMDKLHALAELLLKQETVFQEEVDEVMQGKDIASIIKKMKRRENAENKKLQKEKLEKQRLEEERLRELKEKAFNALKKEGIIPEDQKLEDVIVKSKEDENKGDGDKK